VDTRVRRDDGDTTVIKSFLRYGFVGALATATHFAVLILCVEVFKWPAHIVSGVGAVVGSQVAFVGNRRFTFAHKGKLVPAWLRFHGTALLGALVGMVIVAAAVHAGWHYLVGQVVATLTGLVLTFAINRAWTFR
jgi:putative flippase GtrA